MKKTNSIILIAVGIIFLIFYSGTKVVSQTSNEDIREYSVDSIHIGQSGKNKIEITQFLGDSISYVVINFYTKSDNDKWTLNQTFTFDKDLISYCDMQITDFNNDGLGDMTYISAIAARGANEIRKLFIYDKNIDKLICLKNSEYFPNLRYNEKLNCINAFRVYAGCSTDFLKIQSDSLKMFASVAVMHEYYWVHEYDEFGNEKTIEEGKYEGEPYPLFENYKPLEIKLFE